MPIRPTFKLDMAILKPSPSLPRSCVRGTTHWSKFNCTVLDPCSPIFFSFLPITRPRLFFSTINALIPFAPCSSLVRANVMYVSASIPLWLTFLNPLKKNFPPPFFAFFFNLQPSNLPLAPFGAKPPRNQHQQVWV